MGTVDSNTLPPMRLKKKDIEVKELGGTIVVREMTLSEKLTLTEVQHHEYVATILALTVESTQGGPLPDAELDQRKEYWDVFASRHQDSAIAVVNAAKDLARFDELEGGSEGNAKSASS